jgi:hypothetical protein
MHGGTDNGFHRLQIEPALVAAFLKNNAQKTIYFADGFFSCGVASACSTGRKRQICVLTSTNC